MVIVLDNRYHFLQRLLQVHENLLSHDASKSSSVTTEKKLKDSIYGLSGNKYRPSKKQLQHTLDVSHAFLFIYASIC